MCDARQAAAAPGDSLDVLIEAAMQLRAAPPVERTPEQLGEHLVRLRHACDLLELAFAADAARFSETDEYEWQGSVSPVDWIRHACHMSSSTAAAAVCVGAEAAHLPLSVAAVEEGRVGFAHLTVLAGTAAALRRSRTAAGLDEQALLEKAMAHSVGRFRHECHHVRHAADAERVLEEHVDSVERRFLELSPCAEGLWLRGLLDGVGGAALRSALEPLAARRDGDDSRHRDRRLADALVELAHHGLDAGVAGHGRARSAHLQVTASVETLIGLRGAAAGELELSPPIPAATVQRLACHAGITRILLGPDSAVVDVGRSRRVPAASTRRALAHRDRGCVWPRCERPVSWTQPHHVVHWAHGGATDVANLVLLCHRHHWLAHEGGWQVARTDAGEILTVPPLPRYLPPARAPAAHAAA